LDEGDIYRVIGEEGFARLVAGFYRQVPGDAVLGPMYPPHDLAGAERRLRDFLVGRFGGPPRYIEERGHPRLRMRHHLFPIDARARARWLELMGRALDEAGLPGEPAAVLRAFFESVATMLVNRREPGEPGGE
jgi:hemoglobin